MGETVVPAAADKTPPRQVYVPYRAGLPPFGPYFRRVWDRRPFIKELALSTVRAESMDTWFGRLWNILNPLLLGFVYMMLVTILARGVSTPYYLAYLLSGLFIFQVLNQASAAGATSMIRNRALVTKTAVPRIVFPIADVRIAFSRFGPMLGVLLVISIATGVRPHLAWLACIPLFVFFMAFVTGFVLLLATMQVYLRDTRNFLSYFLRIWLFLSPVLWTVSQTPGFIKAFVLVNPMYSIVGGFSEAFVYGNWPPMSYWVASCLWAVGMLFAGSYFFLTREREFAIRL